MSIVKRVKNKKFTNDKYQEYLTHSGEPKDNFSNPLNLFDDLNRKDGMWLTIARKFLARNNNTAE